MAKLLNLLLWLAISSVCFARPPKKYPDGVFYKGFDLSSLKIMEDGGAIYKDAQHGNVTLPVEQILQGMNTVRLRLWVNPTVPFDDGCEFFCQWVIFIFADVQ
jgi:arabinogalactan endo-1,4-beta-galactosidase